MRCQRWKNLSSSRLIRRRWEARAEIEAVAYLWRGGIYGWTLASEVSEVSSWVSNLPTVSAIRVWAVRGHCGDKSPLVLVDGVPTGLGRPSSGPL